jgi:hypothetical protein
MYKQKIIINKMQSLAILYIYVFVIIPLLFFMGISIVVKKEQFHLFPVFSLILIGLILIIHTHTFVEFIRGIFSKKRIPISKGIGIFLLFLGIALLLLNGWFLYEHYHS